MADSGPKDSCHTVSSDSECTDPCSDRFNPIAALNSPAHPSLPETSALKSLTEVEEFVKNSEEFLAKEKAFEEKRRIQQDLKQKQLELLEKNNPPVARANNVISKMEKFSGPKEKLAEWVKCKMRLKVVIRSHTAIRGLLTGIVVIFDKYLNLAMVDVDEEYTSVHSANRRRKIKQTPSEPLLEKLSSLTLTTSNNIHRRHINQLFVRGDNVVSIYPADR